MDYLEKFGLASVAAVVMMALIGAASASANGGVFCSAQEPTCTAAKKWLVGTVIQTSLKAGSSTRFSETNGTVWDTCTASKFKASITENPSAMGEVKTQNTELTWGEKACTQTTVTTQTGKLRVQNIAVNWNGTVYADEAIKISIGEPACEYSLPAGRDMGEIKEGNPATLVVNVIVETVNFLCRPTLKWEAEYTITAPANTTLAVTPK